MVEEPSRGTVVWAAARTLAMHENTQDEGRTGRCKQCRNDGSCPQIVWAGRELAHLAGRQLAVTRSGEPGGRA